MSARRRSAGETAETATTPEKVEQALPTHNAPDDRSQKRVKWIKKAGESKRTGFHPFHFFKIIWNSASRASKLCNILWPVVPVAIAVYWSLPDNHVLIFTLSYLAMIPCANLIGFAGQELARKMPHVAGVLVETTLGSIVEIVLFILLLVEDEFIVIQAAILGSILATMLLCLGLCFFAAGVRRDVTGFHDAVSEAGSGLLLTAGVALAIPTAYEHSLADQLTPQEISEQTVTISRIVAILLWIAYAVYIWFQAHTHHGLFDEVFREDEARDHDRDQDLAKAKLTLTECIIGLAISIALVTLIAYILVRQIKPIVEDRHVSDAFLGLILVPVVEKAAEHLTAVDEAWDNQMNMALSHVLGATLQTALFNAPLVVIVGWGLGKSMDFNFEIFHIVMLILAIITVGGFLRDQKSNYLEGFLCVIVYVAIAVAAFYYPDPPLHGSGEGTATGEPSAAEPTAVGGH